MGSNINFKNFGNDLSADGGGGGRPPGNFPLTRQSSIYSLTFDEFQNTVGGSGKDFGSMNMDELLKSIWSAEENQNFAFSTTTAAAAAVSGVQEVGGGLLQRQGSLTLPRTVSQKTVDEVWRDMAKEYGHGGGGKVANRGGGGGGIGGGSSVPQRQTTLGEITLEEFLVRAGVVREDAQAHVRNSTNNNNNNIGLFGVNNSSLGFGYQQQTPQQQASILPLNVNGVRSAQQQQQQQQQQQILPKQPMAYRPPMGIPNGGQLSSPRIGGGIVGISDQAMNNAMVQNMALQGGGLGGMVGLGGNGVGVGAGSPAVSSDGLTKSNGDTSSVSPVPYVFNGGLRGRKSAALEKVVERRQRRMIKNRESAARSRARKQAYTMELEAEVAKLKEENEELQKKQEEMMEMQKNQAMEIMKQQNGAKRQCLRRTQTGPW